MSRLILAGLAASFLTMGVAHAASADYYLKIPPIEGESESMKPEVEPGEIDSRASAPARPKVGDTTLERGTSEAARGGKSGNAETTWKVEKGEKATDDDHKDWVELLSLSEATSAQATGRRTYEPITIRKRIDSSSPDQQEQDELGDLAAPASDPIAIGLLLPAVQKVREAAARTGAWPGCRAGQELPGVEIMEASTGRRGRILDATVSQCASEEVSFNFSKIEWD